MDVSEDIVLLPKEAEGEAVTQEMEAGGLRLLPFQQRMFESLQAEEDSLNVIAKGLGLHHLLMNLLRVYCSDRALVLVINTNEQDRDAYIQELQQLEPEHPPRVLSSDQTAEERRDFYMSGVVFVTSRILVVDMLLERTPLDLITGFVVCNAHRVTPTSTEAFILRLFRHKNRIGFIKAITDHPEGFTGHHTVEKALKTLWIKKVFMWPRFHADLMTQLAKCAPEVIEIKVPMTERMLAVQQAIAELIKGCLRELQRLRPGLDDEQMTLERGLFAAFDQYLRRQLDPIWHTLGTKTKQLVTDLRTLRSIVMFLHQYDCISFYHYLDTLRASHSALNQRSYWELMDATQDLYINAKWRVYATPSKASSSPVKTRDLKPDPEPNPKWTALLQVLEEIDELVETQADELGQRPRTLICVEDSRTCTQLQQVIAEGAEVVLDQQYVRYRRWRKRLSSANVSSMFKSAPNPYQSKGKGKVNSKLQGRRNKRRRIELAVMGASSGAEALEMLEELQEEASEVSFDDAVMLQNVVTVTDPVTEYEEHGGEFLSGSVKVLHALQGGSGSSQFSAVLRRVQPNFIIMYDPTLSCLREIEVYKAARPSAHLRVYFMTFDASFQEQKYLSSIRHEKEAFEKLINAKSRFAIPEDQVEDDRCWALTDLRMADLDIDKNKRKCYINGQTKWPIHERLVVKCAKKSLAGYVAGVTAPHGPKVIVDMREFRSTLPALIHEFNMAVIPVTLVVGDYVLSPEICVERKSVPDLIQSLSSGRLYNQALAMTRHYSTPALLIEFDQDKSFSLIVSETPILSHIVQGASDSLSNDIDFKNITSKLTLLSISFPNLRLLWSRSLFASLKQHSKEPDAEYAASLGDEQGDLDNDVYATGPQALLRKLPGVSTRNIRSLMENVENIRELVKTSEKDLQSYIGQDDGSILYKFLHNKSK